MGHIRGGTRSLDNGSHIPTLPQHRGFSVLGFGFTSYMGFPKAGKFFRFFMIMVGCILFRFILRSPYTKRSYVGFTVR